MTTAKDLLLGADPLTYEPPLPAARRERMRQTIVAAATDRSAITRGASFRMRAIALAAAVIVAATIVGSQIWSRSSAIVEAAVRFEIRLAEDQPAAGLQMAKISSTRVVYLHPDAIVTNADIASSRVVPGRTPGHFSIDVQLTPSGGQKMHDATAMHVGKPVAILLDGDVVMAPTVRSAIGGSAMITGDYTRAQAERIVNGMSLNR